MSKPFNLEDALAGFPVETKLGVPVTKLVYFEGTDEPYPIVAVTNNQINTYTLEGRFSLSAPDEGDLVMSDPKPVEPEVGDKYFLPDVVSEELYSGPYNWQGDSDDLYVLNTNVCFKTREDAIECSKSLLEFLANK